MGLYPSVFIDRDGTVNVDGGYINHPENFVIYPFAAQAVRMLNMAGYLAVIVTNQSGIGRGIYTEALMNRLHKKMLAQFAEQGAHVDGIYYCPHDSGSKIPEYKADCDCRKPHPGMLLNAFKHLPVDKNTMFMIGDKYSDLEAGWAVGASGILVKTGYGRGFLADKSEGWAKQPDYVAENLLEAVKFILS